LKKITLLAFLCVAVILTGLTFGLGSVALAGSGDVSVTTYEELKTALSSVGSGDIISVTQDIICIEMENSKTLSIPSGATLKIENGVALTISKGVSLQNMSSTIAIEGTLSIVSKYGGNGNIVNGSTVTIASGGQLINSGGSFQHFGTLTNNGTLTNENGFYSTGLGTINNNGTFTNNDDLENTFTINNYGTFTNNGDITNSGTIYNKSTGTINNFGTIDNSSGGAVVNQGGGVSFYPKLTRTQTTVSGTVGRVGDKTFTAALSNSYSEPITFTISVAGLSVTASRSGDGTVSAVFPGDDLNGLSVGTYDVTMSSDATECNAAIESTLICKLAINKTAPVISGSNIISGTVGTLETRTITAMLTNSYPEDITMRANVSGTGIEKTFVHSAGDGGISVDFTAEELNELEPGSYMIWVETYASANNLHVTTSIGTITLSVARPAVSGSNLLSGTVSRLEAQTVTAVVTDSYPEELEWTVHIADASVIASRIGDGDVSFLLTADILNTLTVGCYSITVTSATAEYNTAVTAAIGTITVSPITPILTGSSDLAGTIGSVGSQTAQALLSNSYPEEMTLTAHLADIDVSTLITGDGRVSFDFSQAQLDALGAGVYTITVTAAATENNTAIASVSIGSLIVRKATPDLIGGNCFIVLEGMAEEQTATAILTNCFPESLTLTANAGGILVPVTLNDNGTVDFVFAADDISKLPLGEYPIIVTSEETAGNKAISVSIGTLTVLAPHALAINSGTGGCIAEGSSGYYGNGMKIVLEAEPNEGFQFDKWAATSGSFEDVQNVSTTYVMPDQNAVVTALFKKVVKSPVITTISLNSGTVGTVYSQTLAADGDTPVTWSIDSGDLPDGLSLSSGGIISGTPTEAGTFQFTVKVKNAAGNDVQDLCIVIQESASTDRTLVRIIAPVSITGVANGTANTATALGLPETVILVTDGGNVQGYVKWNMASCTYDPSSRGTKTFTVDGTAILPSGVINPNSVSLNVTINITVNANDDAGDNAGDDASDDMTGKMTGQTNDTDEDIPDTGDAGETKTEAALTITPKTVKENKDVGTVTIVINVSDFPEGTVAVRLPDGTVINMDSGETIEMTIYIADLNADGVIQIAALDNEGMPLGDFDVQVELEDVIGHLDVEEVGASFLTVIWWILGGLLVAGGVAVTMYLILRKSKVK